MSTIDMTVIYNPTNPTIVIKLRKGDSIAVRLTTKSFPPDSAPRINEVTIFENRIENGVSKPGDPVCSYARDSTGTNPCEAYYKIAFGDETHVTLTDNQEQPSPDKASDTHWFGVSGTFNGGSWSADPELINRPEPP